MPEISAGIQVDASPEAIWRVLMGLDAWPEWSPLIQAVRMNDPASGTAGGFHLQGLLGRVPYSGEFMVPDYRPLERFIFESVTISPPYDVLWHDIRLHGKELTWTIVYEMAGGPGGWVVDQLMVRRSAQGLLDRGVRALADQVT
ncbi:hypothetical protein BH24CHL1_BH24CHL1_10160 [soil metagenome]